MNEPIGDDVSFAPDTTFEHGDHNGDGGNVMENVVIT